MVQSCSVKGCSRLEKHSKISFYRFPKNKVQCLEWIKFVQIAREEPNWNANNHSRLCGKHFITGVPSYTPGSVDFAPTLFCNNTEDNVSSAFAGKKRLGKPYELLISRSSTPKRKPLVPITPNDGDTTLHPCDFSLVEDVSFINPFNDNEDSITQKRRNSELNPSSFSLAVSDDSGISVSSASFESCTSNSSSLVNVKKKQNIENAQLLNRIKLLEVQLKDAVQGKSLVMEKLKTAENDCKLLRLEKIRMQENNEAMQATINNLRECKQEITERFEEVLASHEELQKEMDITNEKKENVVPYEVYVSDDSKCKFYCGLPNKQLFDAIVNETEHLVQIKRETKLSRHHRVLIVLMKLRLNLMEQDLADRFYIHQTTVSKIMSLWIPVLAKVIGAFVYWPSRENILGSAPNCFRNSKYKETICIIDCLEIFCEEATNHLMKTLNFSHYKSHQTLKVLVGISPSGMIIFISQCWVGKSSDKEVTLGSGFIDNLNSGDLVLADKGFLVHEEFIRRGIKIIMPSFKKSKTQLSMSEVNTSQEIANVRIHVERVIGLLRNFKILREVLPCTGFAQIDNIVRICAGIVNLNDPIVN